MNQQDPDEHEADEWHGERPTAHRLSFRSAVAWLIAGVLGFSLNEGLKCVTTSVPVTIDIHVRRGVARFDRVMINDVCARVTPIEADPTGSESQRLRHPGTWGVDGRGSVNIMKQGERQNPLPTKKNDVDPRQSDDYIPLRPIRLSSRAELDNHRLVLEVSAKKERETGNGDDFGARDRKTVDLAWDMIGKGGREVTLELVGGEEHEGWLADVTVVFEVRRGRR